MTGKSSTLSLALARRILDLAREQDLPAGAHLGERELADTFQVSRSPVREALRLLENMGAVEVRPHRGCFLRESGASLDAARQHLTHQVDEAPYLQIAADRLAGSLPERVTEAQLLRRYGVSRGELTAMLTRMTQEGWITRRDGYGWSFLPVLASAEAHQQGYRFRAALEPAALLEPGYAIDRTAFNRRRAEQRALVEGRIHEVSPAELFGFGAGFHETIVGCSGNPYFLESLQRINRLRRLIEYRAMVETKRFVVQAREHLEILDRLEGGDRDGAAALLRRHLDAVQAVKLGALAAGLSGPAQRRANRGSSTDEPMAHVHF